MFKERLGIIKNGVIFISIYTLIKCKISLILKSRAKANINLPSNPFIWKTFSFISPEEMIHFNWNLVCMLRERGIVREQNLMNQSDVISELNVVNPQRTYPLFSPTYKYFCLNFCSFYCHVILIMQKKSHNFQIFFPLSKAIYSYFPFQIPFVHNFLENWYFP